MTYGRLKAEAGGYAPALALDVLMSRTLRKRARTVFGLAALFAGFYSIVSLFVFPTSWSLPLIESVALLATACYMVFRLFEFFYNSYYFNELAIPGGISFDVATIILASKNEQDIRRAFVTSSIGQDVLLRAGFDLASAGALLSQPSGVVSSADIPTRLKDLAQFLLTTDTAFRDALFAGGVKEEDFLGSAEWFERAALAYKRIERSWSKEQLSRVPSIARDWSYGHAYALDTFTTYLRNTSAYQTTDSDSARARPEVAQLEAILSRSSGANALLVGSEGGGALEVVALLSHAIADGLMLPGLRHKDVVVLEGEDMISRTGDKVSFERTLASALASAHAAGSVILVLPHLSAFLESAHALGSQVLDILEPYLASDQLQIIAIVEPDPFYRSLESNGGLMSHFEVVKVEAPDEIGLIHLLEEAALREESRSRVVFTYPSLVEVAHSATRYFPGAVLPDKAYDLLREVAPAAHQKGTVVITRADVRALVESKTGIPLGEVSNEEKEKLQNLEAILHKRVVGQDDAIKSVADAMRRARAGIRNQDRPMGLFLFLGPTGVGKTETAKALSDLFFGEKHPLLRLDMSEYTTMDAVDKLIGSFDTNRAGTLAVMLKETPYGVLLLDEFEKSAPEVKDLFLQVFDEGMFSDKSGKKINARNVIIIATSNAGSEMIWEYFKQGQDPAAHKRELVDAIIQAHIFKPELVNRFDGVVVFHPVAGDKLNDVARMLLERFADRLRKEKGIALVVNDTLVSHVMQFGNDPQFGARPMNRAIQDTVEKLVAGKILSGALAAGSTLELTKEELERGA